jgi:hypothetical protein
MWSWTRKPPREGFPNKFRTQLIVSPAAMGISTLPPWEVAKYFRHHPEIAEALLDESYNKRCSPSTFMVDEGGGLFRVGWFTRDANYQCVREFSNLADAATDYLLFSLGKARWDPASEPSQADK